MDSNHLICNFFNFCFYLKNRCLRNGVHNNMVQQHIGKYRVINYFLYNIYSNLPQITLAIYKYYNILAFSVLPS